MNFKVSPTFPALARELFRMRSGEQDPASQLQECRLPPEAGLFVAVWDSQPRGVVTLRKEGHWASSGGKSGQAGPCGIASHPSPPSPPPPAPGSLAKYSLL